jgi:MoaA/NifB/PqqE/SkfB family radical SAM enzyme
LNEELIKAAAQCRLEFFVSIDGFSKDIYENIRSGASFDRLITNLQAIKDYKAATKSKWPKLRLNFTMMRRNLEEFQRMHDFCHRYGFETVFLRHLIVWPQLEEFLPESLYFSKELYNSYVDNYIYPLKKSGIKVIHPPQYDLSLESPTDQKKFTKGGCALPWFSFQITVDGLFKICRLGIFNDVNHNYWNIIDNNQILRQELAKVLDGTNEKCQHCIGIGATNINVNRKENYFLDLDREKVLKPTVVL